MNDIMPGKSDAKKSKVRKVEKFFSLVVDDFFTNPKIVVDYLKSLPTTTAPEGEWPGTRTKPLFQIDKDLNTAMMLKILSCYYDLTYQDISWERGRLFFQSIPPFSSDKNDIRNKGWIHQDTASNAEYELAGIIYLNEKIDPDSGTSIFKMVDDNYVTYQRHFAKHILFKNEKDFDEEYYTKQYDNHLSHFVEKTRFQNIYNRLIMFDPNEFHRANNYYVGSENDPRLTLVYFIGGLQAGRYPMNRIKNEEYDSFIDFRLRSKK